MKAGHLSTYFSGTASKRLSQVEVNPRTSNQHEFNGTLPLKSLLGLEKKTFAVRFVYLGQDEDETTLSEASGTWYDSRANNPSRPAEYRLYYSPNDVIQRAAAGDLLVIARRPEGDSLVLIIAQAGSAAENSLKWLFQIEEQERKDPGRFELRQIAGSDDRPLDYVARLVLEQIGEEITEEVPSQYLEMLVREFGGVFPTTREFSAFARKMMSEVSAVNDPDEALVAWLDFEEMLFRTLEKHLVREELERGFVDNGDVDVERFVKFSLSVQNRRKSRAGLALENHLEHIFHKNQLRFAVRQVTEQKSKPDFLFPGITEYRDSLFPPEQLAMLGAKFSCKDRWRQVLSEARRIENKHLLTLQPGISADQTDEMQSHGLQLVLPRPIHRTYTPNQQSWIWSLSVFIEEVRKKQTLARSL